MSVFYRVQFLKSRKTTSHLSCYWHQSSHKAAHRIVYFFSYYLFSRFIQNSFAILLTTLVKMLSFMCIYRIYDKPEFLKLCSVAHRPYNFCSDIVPTAPSTYTTSFHFGQNHPIRSVLQIQIHKICLSMWSVLYTTSNWHLSIFSHLTVLLYRNLQPIWGKVVINQYTQSCPFLDCQKVNMGLTSPCSVCSRTPAQGKCSNLNGEPH